MPVVGVTVFSVRIITAQLVLKHASPIKYHTSSCLANVVAIVLIISLVPEPLAIVYCSVYQTVVRGPQVVLGFCPCGPFRLNISPKKTEKIKLT